jgi:hypothetical protein
MANKNGGYSMDDLRAAKFQSAAEFGLDTINETLQGDLRNWEAQVSEAITAFCETTTDRQRIWGSSAVVDMEELGEFGRPRTAKNNVGNTCGFRLNRFGSAIGYTDMWLKSHSPAELVEKQLQVERGHNERIMKEIKKAIYTKDNETFTDVLVDRVDLPVKAFINADSSNIPDAPDGTKFAGTHQHYINRAGGALAAVDIDNVVKLVAEHGFSGIVLYIALADLTAISALANFTKLATPLMEYHSTNVTTQRLDTGADPSDRLVGFWGENMVPVYTKKWAIAKYFVCLALEAPEKPLVRRQHTVPALQGLRLEAKIDAYPLISDNYVALEGYSVWNRLAGAVLYDAAAYANPVIG